MVALLSGCLFVPAVQQHGYTTCESSADCAAGRSCEVGLCAPPPWNDDGYGERSLLVVEAAGAVPAGAAVPVRIGAGGILDSGDLGPDGRFTFFTDVPGSGTAGTWETLPTFLDIYGDHLLVWMPTTNALSAGGSDQLAWLEASTGEIEPTGLIEPESVFELFDDFDGQLLDPQLWETFGAGDPLVAESEVTVASGQRLVLARALEPPFSVTLRGRINGAACDRFFLGLEGDEAPSYTAPSVGLFATSGLTAVAEVAPTSDSVPRPVEEGIALDTAEHRYRFDVGGGQVKLYIDDVAVAEPDLRPPLEADALYFVIDVDGDCSFEAERVMVTPLPLEGVTVSVEPKVIFQVFE
jgi:hypothetical protein